MQALAGAEEPALERGWTDAQGAGGGGEGLTLKVAHLDGTAEGGGETAEEEMEALVALAFGAQRFGRGAGIGMGAANSGDLLERGEGVGTGAAAVAARRIDHDASEPGKQLAAPGELVEVAVGEQEGVLEGILGVGGVMQLLQGGAVETFMVTLDLSLQAGCAGQQKLPGSGKTCIGGHELTPDLTAKTASVRAEGAIRGPEITRGAGNLGQPDDAGRHRGRKR